MPHARYSTDEIAERGQTVYEQEIRQKLEPDSRGKFLVVDIETGAYELDSDELVALKRARLKSPEGAFYILRIGHPTAYRLGRKAVTAEAC